MYKCELDLSYHNELLDVIKDSKAKIIISGYDNDLYNKKLSDWYCDEIDTIAQMGLKRRYRAAV